MENESVHTDDFIERRRQPRPDDGLDIDVLIVDDSQTALYSLRTILKQAGCRVIEAMDGAEAVRMAETHQPDLIFMDVVIPQLNGYQAIRAIRRQQANQRYTPIIMMSADSSDNLLFWGQRVGADAFIGKPFIRAELFSHLNNFLSLNAEQPTSWVQ